MILLDALISAEMLIQGECQLYCCCSDDFRKSTMRGTSAS